MGQSQVQKALHTRAEKLAHEKCVFARRKAGDHELRLEPLAGAKLLHRTDLELVRMRSTFWRRFTMLMRNKLQDTTYRTTYARQLLQRVEPADESSDMHKRCKAGAVCQMEKPRIWAARRGAFHCGLPLHWKCMYS